MKRCGCVIPSLSTDGAFCTRCRCYIAVPAAAVELHPIRDFDDADITPPMRPSRPDQVIMRVAERIEKLEAIAREAIRIATTPGTAMVHVGESRAALADQLDPLFVLDLIELARRALR